jgi:hypothetical protein
MRFAALLALLLSFYVHATVVAPDEYTGKSTGGGGVSEGTDILSTGEAANLFLKTDGADGASWSAVTMEGTSVLSTAAGSGLVLTANGAGAATWTSVAGTGDVVGPASVTADHLVLFDGTTGKLIKSGGKTLAALQSEVDGKIDGSGAATYVPYFTDSNTLTGSANFTYTASSSGANTGLLVAHASNTASSDASINLSVAGTSGGDPEVLYTVTGGTSWYSGVDNSDSDRFFIGTGTAVGTNPLFRLFTTGTVSFYGPLITYNTAGAAAQVTEFYAGSSGGNDGGLCTYGGNGSGAYACLYGGSHATLASTTNFSGAMRISSNADVFIGSAMGPYSYGFERLGVRLIPASGNAASTHAAAQVQYLNNNGATAFTNTQVGLSTDWRRTITSSTTDTGSIYSLIAGMTYTITAGQTYTNAQTAASLIIAAPASATGTLALTNYSGINVAASTLATGTRKTGILINAQTGATNNAALADNVAYTGTWALNFTNTNPIHFAGYTYIGATAAHSFNTEKLSVTETLTGDGSSHAANSSIITLSGNTAFTGTDIHSVVGAMNRSITSSTTDTVGRYAAVLGRMIWSVSGGQTITHAQTGGVNYFSTSGFPAVTGTVAITHFAGYNMPVISTVTGTNAYGVRIQGLTAANTNNYGIYVGDITTATNSYAIYTGAGGVRLGGLVDASTAGIRTKISTANTDAPPTDAQLDSAFGTPATVGSGFVGVLDDNGAHSVEYLVWSDGTKWFYVAGTEAL